MLKKLISTCIVIAIMLTFTGCNERKKCITVLDDFEKGCNELNIDGILDSINPKVGNTIKIGMGIASLSDDFDETEILEAVEKFILEEESGDIKGFFESIKFTQKKAKVKDDDAVIYTVVEFKVFEASIEQNAEVSLIEKTNKWYINGIKFIED